MTVIVAGQSRKAGKTRAVCDIIAATRDARWTAVKISPHDHDTAPGGGDTQRYLDAGAAAAYLLTSPAGIPDAANLIVESNAAAAQIPADLVIFVRDPGAAEWKESAAAALDRADLVVDNRITADVLDRIKKGLSELPPLDPGGSPHRPPE